MSPGRPSGEQKAIESLRQSLLAAVSHELKTPLAIIRGYAETLAREDVPWDPRTVREGLEVILQEARHMDRLVDDLLDAARAQERALTFHIADLNLPRLARRLVEAYRASDPHTRWQLDFPADFPSVPADPDRVAQALRNLMDNARDHSPPGSVIRVSGRVERQWVTCCVQDQGPGVAPGEREKIFDRFSRGEAPRRKRREGAGLGLFIARALVEGHAGRIWVESPAEGGARFCFTLPRYRSRRQVAL